MSPNQLMTTEAPAITMDVEDGVARIRLAQPDRGNPFDKAFTDTLSDLANRCAIDPAVRAVLIEADGRFFSVGGDLQTLSATREGLRTFIYEGTNGLHAAVARFARGDAPVVVAVHAMCAGGGVSLAAAADFCLAGASAKFYAAYAGVGLAIDGGGSHFLPRRVGSRRAASFYLRNEMWSAAQALEYGLINEIVDDDALPAAALALARELAAGPTRSLGEIKRLLTSSYDTPLDAQLELEAHAMARTALTEDTFNALTAVAAKQRPTFEGH